MRSSTEDATAAAAVPQRGRFGDRAAQRLDAVRRWRRVRLGRRDRHRHRQHCMRAARSASSSSPASNTACAARGPDPAVTARAGSINALARRRARRRACPATRPACASACSAARSIRRMPAISPCQPARAEAARARPRLVAGHARQSAEEHAGLPRLAGRAPTPRETCARSAHRRHRPRGRIGTRYTVDTIAFAGAALPGVRFVWIMGADNLAQFHRWQHWRASPRMCRSR